MTTKKELIQKIHAARLAVEARIREAKKLRRSAESIDERGEAQRTLFRLRQEATAIYTALAASRGKAHNAKSAEFTSALLIRAARHVRYVSEGTQLAVELLTLLAQPQPTPVPEVAAAV